MSPLRVFTGEFLINVVLFTVVFAIMNAVWPASRGVFATTLWQPFLFGFAYGASALIWPGKREELGTGGNMVAHVAAATLGAGIPLLGLAQVFPPVG